MSYADVYESCTGYRISDLTLLPNRICNNCEENLISHHNFRLSIDKVEERLQAYQIEIGLKTEITVEGSHEALTDDEAALENNSEEFVIEQIYDDEEQMFLETSGDGFQEADESFEFCVEDATEDNFESKSNESPACYFVQSERSYNQVECKTCQKDCELEAMINSARPEVDIPIKCECEKTLKNRRSFSKHFTTIHRTSNSIFLCRSCPETFDSRRSKVAHEAKMHNIGFKYKCGKCDKKFYRSDHCKEHSNACNRSVDNSEKFFSCSVCLFTFQREDTFKKHLETAHVGVSESTVEYASRADEYAQKYSKVRKFADLDAEKIIEKPTCDVCKKIFRNEQSLSKHISLFHSNQSYVCDQCGATFIHRSTKISHMSKVHGMKKPFECSYPDCGFSCLKKDRFTAHIEKHENPDKMFPCPICQQEFKSYNSMTQHRAKHLTKRTFICATCSKQFLDKRNYNVHMKLHTGEGLYNCPSCGHGFNRKDHLQTHQKRKNHYAPSDAQE